MSRPLYNHDQILHSVQERIVGHPDLIALIETPIKSWPDLGHWVWTGAKTQAAEGRLRAQRRFDRAGFYYQTAVHLKPYAFMPTLRRLGGGEKRLRYVQNALYMLTHREQWGANVRITKPYWCDQTLCVNPAHWEPVARTGGGKGEVVIDTPHQSREDYLDELRRELRDNVDCDITSLAALIEKNFAYKSEDIEAVIDKDPWLKQRVK